MGVETLKNARREKFIIFRRICIIQEKLFIQYSVQLCQISSFSAKLPTFFIQK